MMQTSQNVTKRKDNKQLILKEEEEVYCKIFAYSLFFVTICILQKPRGIFFIIWKLEIISRSKILTEGAMLSRSEISCTSNQNSDVSSGFTNQRPCRVKTCAKAIYSAAVKLILYVFASTSNLRTKEADCPEL